MSNPFIENQDLLLSCTLSDQNEFSFLNEEPPINPSNFISVDLNEQKEIKDEIDFDIFDILQQQDPDIVRLLESVSSDTTPNYLPQISINTTTRVLDDFENKETSQIVSLAESNDNLEENNDIKNVNPVTLTPTPSRVSMRLIKKKKPFSDEIYDEPKKARKTPIKAQKAQKRKRSIDDEEDLKINNHNENTFDESVYNDDSCSLQSYDSKYFTMGSRGSRLDSKDLDPIKKESNKEAATRYRIKKSNERESLFQTKQNLEKDNDQIRQRIELIQIEISYLKNMLVQTLLTKGILNNSGTEIF
ncbi:unnamed protein product [Brachionus calyciflorus]|uniref:BZIP domain-containing protein n=1 Tax=Brachionus calyciflorus TaxID=104777 RepID=A0A814NYA5_9BILA|nr:unnamed protein product [Brachionus calyciflorus]